MKYDLTTFGEAMARISVRPGYSLEDACEAELHTGGSESNTASALARLGMKTAWVSRLTDNSLGRRILTDAARSGADTSGVIMTPKDRVGMYYVEYAKAPCTSSVIYDRRNSAFSKLAPKELDWKLLLDTRMLHLTGITPALSPGCREATSEAVKKAHAKKISVSFDINYRTKLWNPATAAEVLTPLIHNANLLIMTRDDAAAVFDLEGEPEQVVCEIRDRFNAKAAVLTLGSLGAVLYNGEDIIHEPGYPVIEVVDRLGAGDAFTAGLIFGWLHKDLPLGLKFGIAMSAMKMGMKGDYFRASRAEVEQVIKARGGDVRR